MVPITDYSQIQAEFDRLYNDVTSQDFKARVKILGTPEVYEHTHGRTAALVRGFLWTPAKIWIREMPNYQMFYELAHEAGHSAKPYFENTSLDAEETKACLFQHIFSQMVKTEKFEWLDDFVAFEAYRKDHISRNDPKYLDYHNAAQHIARQSNNDFAKGVQHISLILKFL
jgi:hypothetical protein